MVPVAEVEGVGAEGMLVPPAEVEYQFRVPPGAAEAVRVVAVAPSQ
nr:hypothetical protein [Persicitalea jodogahamensis]